MAVDGLPAGIGGDGGGDGIALGVAGRSVVEQGLWALSEGVYPSPLREDGMSHASRVVEKRAM